MQRFLLSFNALIFVLASSFGSVKPVEQKDLESCFNDQNPIQDIDEIIGEVRGLYEDMLEVAKIDEILTGKEVDLPVRIMPPNGDSDYCIFIHNINFTPEYAYAVMSMYIPLGEDDADNGAEALVFYANDVRFTRAGGFTGNLTLELIQSVPISLGEETTMEILAGNQSPTYVSFDCDGFQELMLSAEIEFSDEFIVPEGADGEIIEGQKVTTSFNTQVKDWNDWVVHLEELPAFQFTEAPDFSVSVTNLVVDHSSSETPSVVTFPDNYVNGDSYSEGDPLWRGVYLEEMVVKFPRSFERRSSNERVTIIGSDFVIDRSGFTGHIEANEVFPLDDGNMRGWQYSLNNFELTFANSALRELGFEGQLLLPVSSEEKSLKYTGHYAADNSTYIFNVETEDEIDLIQWKAVDVALHENSSIEIKVQNKRFLPSANLHGSMNVGMVMGSDDESSAFLNIEFSDLELQTVKPFMDIGEVDVGGSATLKGFPISLSGLGVTSAQDGEKMGLSLNVFLNLMGDDDGDGFGAGSGFTIWGKRLASNQRWEYDYTDKDAFEVDVSNGTYEFKGSILFFDDDEDFGDGFNGSVYVKVKPKIEGEASAIFGRVEGKRYWYVDAAVAPPTPIPLFAGISANRFSLGAYYRMEMVLGEDNQSELGETASGIFYQPAIDENAGLGIKAGISIIAAESETVFNGDLNFEIAFNENNGVRYIAFSGGAKFVAPPEEFESLEELSEVANDVGASEDKVQEAAVRADWMTQYDLERDILQGNFNVYVNLIDVVRGNMGGNKAGEIDLYFGPDEWYVHVGRPDRMNGISIVGLLEANSYMIVGDQLPTPKIAPMPDGVTEEEEDFINEKMLGEGAGIGFGARIGVDLRFDVGIPPCNSGVYGAFALGAGFDILLMQNHEPVSCKKVEGPRGFNNWYASGQAYAFMLARLGIKYDCSLASGEMDLLAASLSIAMAAQLPNPSYFKGRAAFKIEPPGLGSLISAEAEFNVEFGDECMLKGQEGDKDIQLITSIKPENGNENVDVYATPEVQLRYAHEEIVELKDVDGGDVENVKLSEYRPYFDPEEAFIVQCISCEGEPVIEGSFEWSDAEDRVVFKPESVLPSGEEIRVIAKVELQRNAGGWSLQHTQSDTSVFRTGNDDHQIPKSNIAYSYPLPEMQNFYPKESSKGYIKTLVAPDLPMELPHGYVFELRIMDGGELVASNRTVDINTIDGYDFEFDIPEDELSLGKDYKLQIVKTPEVDQEGALDDIEEGSQQGQYPMGEGEDLKVVEYSFRTSNYETFTAKFSSYTGGNVTVNADDGVIEHNLEVLTGGNSEAMAVEETLGYVRNGVTQAEPLVRMRALPLEESFMESINNNIFSYTNAELPSLEKTYNLEEAIFFNHGMNDTKILYELPRFIMEDKVVVEDWLADNDQEVPELSGFPEGEYEYRMRYFLPGKDTPTATVTLSFNINQKIEI